MAPIIILIKTIILIILPQTISNITNDKRVPLCTFAYNKIQLNEGRDITIGPMLYFPLNEALSILSAFE